MNQTDKDRDRYLFILYSFENRGDEAMTISFKRYLRSRVPQAECHLAFLSGHMITDEAKREGFVPRVMSVKRRFLYEAIEKVQKPFLKFPVTIYGRHICHLVKKQKFKAVFEIPGLSYTSIFGVRQIADLGAILKACADTGTPYYSLPQSFGPLSDNQQKLFHVIDHSHAKFMFRDDVSFQQAQEAGLSAASRCADMAFLLENANKQYGQQLLAEIGSGPSETERTVAIIPNMKICQSNPNYVQDLARIVEQLITRCDLRVVLTSHEYMNNVIDDRYILASVADRLSPHFNRKLFLTKRNLSAEELQHLYAACDLVISSRFHGLVLASAACTPTFSLGRWHHKYEGVMQDLGLSENLFTDTKDSEGFITLIEQGLERLDDTRTLLSGKTATLRKNIISVLDEQIEL